LTQSRGKPKIQLIEISSFFVPPNGSFPFYHDRERIGGIEIYFFPCSGWMSILAILLPYPIVRDDKTSWVRMSSGAQQWGSK